MMPWQDYVALPVPPMFGSMYGWVAWLSQLAFLKIRMVTWISHGKLPSGTIKYTRFKKLKKLEEIVFLRRWHIFSDSQVESFHLTKLHFCIGQHDLWLACSPHIFKKSDACLGVRGASMCGGVWYSWCGRGVCEKECEAERDCMFQYFYLILSLPHCLICT